MGYDPYTNTYVMQKGGQAQERVQLQAKGMLLIQIRSYSAPADSVKTVHRHLCLCSLTHLTDEHKVLLLETLQAS